MLYVTMEPQPGLNIDQFHEWYNNEHGPTRLRIPEIFTNGLRYQATDGLKPTYLAVYDVTDMHHLETPTYTTLRENRSRREAETIGQVAVVRHFYDLVSSKESSNFQPIESLTNDEAEGLVLVSVEVTLKKDSPGALDEVKKWYEEEHVPMLSKVPGWLRTRIFQTSSLEGGDIKLVSLHDYAKKNGLGGPEHKASMDTKWREEVFSKYIADKGRRTYSLFYVFGGGRRDLSSLSRLPGSAVFTSVDGKTHTIPGPNAVISSEVSARDGLDIPYRLEGNPSPSAPVLAFVNSLLTSLHMWDPLIELLKKARPEFKILRYNHRGRNELPSHVPATLDILADDISDLLTELRIPKLHALIGVSQGGATTLKFALKYPSKLDRFIACDFNVASSAANTQAWKDRIAVAESTSEDGTPGIRKLAAATVERWFHPHTMTEKKDTADWMTEMVSKNHVQGFRYGCQALWDYDMKAELGSCTVPGLLVVGEGDGKGALVKAMDGFKDKVGEKGVDLKIVPLAGHLPMAESPNEFLEAVVNFL
jgi:pimeloyl-ACP methyl ester carboxylesterase